MNYNMWILAQANPNVPSGIEGKSLDEIETVTTTTTQDANHIPVAKPKPSPLMQFLPMILIFVVIYFLMFRGPRKQKQNHSKMVQNLAKNDKVRTIGGIIGTVVDIKDDEIVLKIDESNNTKIRVMVSAIGKNLSQEK